MPRSKRGPLGEGRGVGRRAVPLCASAELRLSFGTDRSGRVEVRHLGRGVHGPDHVLARGACALVPRHVARCVLLRRVPAALALGPVLFCARQYPCWRPSSSSTTRTVTTVATTVMGCRRACCCELRRARSINHREEHCTVNGTAPGAALQTTSILLELRLLKKQKGGNIHGT